jgi:hypothetical protein
MADLWWDEKFLTYHYSLENIAKNGSFLLPFQKAPNLVRVGFIGPYSLAYTPDSPINLGSLDKIWSDLLLKYEESELQVRLPPEIYYQELFRANFEVLSRLGARVLYKDINFHLDLTGNFRDSINRNRSRELKRGSLRNFGFKAITLEDAYEVILANRQGKGLKPSLTKEQFNRLYETFPSALRFHGVELEGRVVSSSITMIISPFHAYVFMWGHDPSEPVSGESISTLCEGLFDTFKSEGFQILCLGTASVQGVVDVGLSRYKSSLGAIESLRITMGTIQGTHTE